MNESKLTKDGTLRFPEDKTVEVRILLSNTVTKKVKFFGYEGERICWVRLHGPIYNIFIIAVYFPHRDRFASCQSDTIHDLQTVLKKVSSHFPRLHLHYGRFDEHLRDNVNNLTGKWVIESPSKNSEIILNLMLMYDLCVVNTYFKSMRNKTPHIYPTRNQRLNPPFKT